jgi:hypothetical protein
MNANNQPMKINPIFVLISLTLIVLIALTIRYNLLGFERVPATAEPTKPPEWEMPEGLKSQLVACYKSRFEATIDSCKFLVSPRWYAPVSDVTAGMHIGVGFDYYHMPTCQNPKHSK